MAGHLRHGAGAAAGGRLCVRCGARRRGGRRAAAAHPGHGAVRAGRGAAGDVCGGGDAPGGGRAEVGAQAGAPGRAAALRARGRSGRPRVAQRCRALPSALCARPRAQHGGLRCRSEMETRALPGVQESAEVRASDGPQAGRAACHRPADRAALLEPAWWLGAGSGRQRWRPDARGGRARARSPRSCTTGSRRTCGPAAARMRSQPRPRTGRMAAMRPPSPRPSPRPRGGASRAKRTCSPRAPYCRRANPFKGLCRAQPRRALCARRQLLPRGCSNGLRRVFFLAAVLRGAPGRDALAAGAAWERARAPGRSPRRA